MRQRSRPAVPDDAAVVDDFLKLGGRSAALACCQVRLTANMRRMRARHIGNERDLPQFDGRGTLQGSQGGSRVLSIPKPIVPESTAESHRLNLRN